MDTDAILERLELLLSENIEEAIYRLKGMDLPFDRIRFIQGYIDALEFVQKSIEEFKKDE